MKLTNRNNLPDALLRAVSNDPYNKGTCDFSITELLQPSRAWALTRRYKDDIEEDVEDRLWSLYGQIGHLILERANVADLAEKRFFASIGNHSISGQIDSLMIEGGVLSDFKFTTAWGFMKGRDPKPEWTAQLNMQLELLRQNGVDAKQLRIIGLLRDHSKASAKKNKKYPQGMIAIQEIEMWERAKTIDFMISRIESHAKALKELPKCSGAETWSGRRCQDYCSVSTWCLQFQQSKQTGVLNDEV